MALVLNQLNIPLPAKRLNRQKCHHKILQPTTIILMTKLNYVKRIIKACTRSGFAAACKPRERYSIKFHLYITLWGACVSRAP